MSMSPSWIKFSNFGKIYSKTFFLITLLLACFSCKEVKPVVTSKKITASPNTDSLSTTKVVDFDSYFTPTQTVTTSKGPQNITRNILQDSKGNIWLATWEGLIQYDGTSFTNVTNKEGLRRFRVFALLEDQKQHLWIATIGAGVYHYDGKTFTNYTTADGLVNDRVTCLYEDTKGIIWFGTEGGTSQYDGTTFHSITTEQGLLNNDVNAIVEKEAGIFWIGTRGTACSYDGDSFTEIRNLTGAPFTNVRSIIKDKKGNMWLGGNNGLWRYDGIFFSHYSKNFVGYIYEDRTGNIWTNSEGLSRNQWVLSRYDAKPLNFEKITATPIKTEENMFFGILEDQAGAIWLGSLRGVCRYDGTLFTCFEE